MGYESHGGSYEEKDSNYFTLIGRVVKSQPIVIQEIYHEALLVAIKESYEPTKDGVTQTLLLENVKGILLDTYAKKFSEQNKAGHIPAGFEKELFEICLRSWVASMTIKDLNNASLDYMYFEKEREYRQPSESVVSTIILKTLSADLYKEKEYTRRAFFLGNERSKMFKPSEIDEIKKELKRLEEERTKKEA